MGQYLQIRLLCRPQDTPSHAACGRSRSVLGRGWGACEPLQWARGSCVIFVSQGWSLSCVAKGVANVLLEIAFSSAAVIQRKEKVTQLCPALQPPWLNSPWNSPGQYTGVGSLSLLQGIFSTQGRSNPGLLHCRWILYHLSHQGNPRILEWVAYLFSRGSSRPRNQTGVHCRRILYHRKPIIQKWEIK